MTGQKNILSHSGKSWTSAQKIIFRILFLYVLFLCLPIDSDVYKYVKEIDWLQLNCRDLFIIATWRHFDFVTIDSESGKWGILSYINLVIPFLISIPLAFIWGFFDKKRISYDTLYYWIRVIARYRVGLGLVAWGYRKLIPGQMVLPTMGILDTPYGDIQAQKLYWQAVGITPGYEVFLGFAEFIAGFLLLFRKTTALGAALTAVVLGNVVIANHVYDGSVHVHSFYYTILAIFILWKDLPDIINLLVREKDVLNVHYYPSFSETWKKYARKGAKVFLFGVFVILFFGLQVVDYLYAPYRLPDTPGVAGTKGYYQVTEFRLNNKTVPYSPLDTLRWQDAIFESWSTLNFKVNRVSIMDQSNGGGYSKKDLERSWELAGIGGGRRYYYYEADTIKHILHLQNKNPKHRDEKMDLHYTLSANNRIILRGTNEFRDSIYVVLDRIDKEFPLLKERQKYFETEKDNQLTAESYAVY
jgi:hypothetical protein